jgi:4-amino-4-deoxy-L-arabinose transferase-like glycosyltransferase
VTSGRWGEARWALVGLLLVAWALRLPPLLRDPLHPDEALYGYWGLLIGRGRDPWLARVLVYKPPLLPYTVASSQILLGDTPVALRLPGLMAGVMTVALAGALAHALYRDRCAAVTAALGVALSPFAVALSGTAFPDPLMVALGMAACVAAARGRSLVAGLLIGLSFAAKQTGLVWLPLAVLLSISPRRSPPSRGKPLLSILGGAALVLTVVFAWDAARVAQGADGFWQVGLVGYGGLRLVWPHELWQRLRDWSGLLRHLFASPAINVLLLVGMPLLLWTSLARRPGARSALADLLLVAFSLIYVIFHWLVAFPAWDRYLLPLVPILAVVLGRIVGMAVSGLRFVKLNRRLAITGPLLALLLIGPALRASAGRYPIGSERAAYQGVDDVVSLFSALPEGSVVYHHWLGWHYRYALFEGPVYLAYWPDPAWLARDVQAFGDQEPRYVAFPAWESAARVERALGDVGYVLEPVLTTARRDGRPSFIVYAIGRWCEP